jgi:hypothetical protein
MVRAISEEKMDIDTSPTRICGKQHAAVKQVGGQPGIPKS